MNSKIIKFKKQRLFRPPSSRAVQQHAAIHNCTFAKACLGRNAFSCAKIQFFVAAKSSKIARANSCPQKRCFLLMPPFITIFQAFHSKTAFSKSICFHSFSLKTTSSGMTSPSCSRATFSMYASLV